MLPSQFVRSLLPSRSSNANKGSFGKVLVIAGSKEFPGAPSLVCEAAYRVGAGLVTLAAVEPVYKIVTQKLRELVFILLPGESGVIEESAIEQLKKRVSEFDVIAIGPGFGQHTATKQFLKAFLSLPKLPSLVIDADALNILSSMNDWWKRFQLNAVITPHPKEFSRLTKISVEEIQKNREELAQKFAQDWGVVIVLKGANTVIANSNAEVSVAPFANPLLATAGTGDVLTGVISGFIVQGLNPFDAACTGVFVHGKAAEDLKPKFGESGMLASDLIAQLPSSLNKMRVEYPI